MRMSLEEERRALLEEIEARRSLYRHMLSGENETHQTKGLHGLPQDNRLVQWMLDHPWQLAAGVAVLVWLGPRLIKRHHPGSKRPMQAPADGQRTGLPKAIASMMMIFLKDLRQLQSTASMLHNAWRWLRNAPSPKTPALGKKSQA